MKEYNVIILGAGISGISCSIYLERAGIKTLLIENNMPGGQLNKIDIIENYPGYKKITGSELSFSLLEQINDILSSIKSILAIIFSRNSPCNMALMISGLTLLVITRSISRPP